MDLAAGPGAGPHDSLGSTAGRMEQRADVGGLKDRAAFRDLAQSEARDSKPTCAAYLFLVAAFLFNQTLT
jgi:hypothetical protein